MCGVLYSPADGAVLDTGRSDDPLDDFVGAALPILERNDIKQSSFAYTESWGCMTEQKRFIWLWRVRAKTEGIWRARSSELVFGVEPANTDPAHNRARHHKKRLGLRCPLQKYFAGGRADRRITRGDSGWSLLPTSAGLRWSPISAPFRRWRGWERSPVAPNGDDLPWQFDLPGRCLVRKLWPMSCLHL